MVVEELHEERGGQVHAQSLFVGHAVLADQVDGLARHRQEEPRDVEQVGRGNHRLRTSSLQVGRLYAHMREDKKMTIVKIKIQKIKVHAFERG